MTHTRQGGDQINDGDPLRLGYCRHEGIPTTVTGRRRRRRGTPLEQFAHRLTLQRPLSRGGHPWSFTSRLEREGTVDELARGAGFGDGRTTPAGAQESARDHERGDDAEGP